VGQPGVPGLLQLAGRLRGHNAQLTGSGRHFSLTLAIERSSGQGSAQR
jgi:hypothetical protein